MEELQSFCSLTVTLHPLSQIPLTFTRHCKRPLGTALLSLPSYSILLMFFFAFSLWSACCFSSLALSVVCFSEDLCYTCRSRRLDVRLNGKRTEKWEEEMESGERWYTVEWKRQKRGSQRLLEIYPTIVFFISLFWFEESSNSTLISLLPTAATSCLQRDNHW